MKKNLTCIKYDGTKTEFLKPEYRVDGDFCNGIWVYKDKKKKTLSIKIMTLHDSFFKGFNIPKKARKAISKALESNKPVDTSKWVKPDEETIRNELLGHLAMLLILEEKEGNWKWSEHKHKADVLYSILHSTSPRNPQGLTNFSYFPLETIYVELGNKKELKKQNDIIFSKKVKAEICSDERRTLYQKWLKENTDKMITKVLPKKERGK